MEDLVRRTSLFVPINKRDFVEKAGLRGADAIILDLEDSIPDPEKENARTLVRESVPVVARGGADVIVRINKRSVAEDLDASIWPGVACIMFPKAETAEEIRELDAGISRLEGERGIPAGTIQIALLLESALGVWNAYEVLSASKRVVTAAAGGLDFMLDLGLEPDPRLDHTVYVRQKLLLIARLTGAQSQGTVPVRQANRDAADPRFESALLGRKAGFRGTNLTHPAAIEAMNRGFTPQPEELRQARRVIEAYEEGLRVGIGAVGLDGQMVDLPVALRAQRLIALAEVIAAFEARKAQALEAARG